MQVDTELARAVHAAGRVVRYDAACKRVLAEREVLARVLRGCLREYANVPLEEVAACIVGEPAIDVEPVGRDAAAARVTGISVKDDAIDEGSVEFDLLFDAVVPGTPHASGDGDAIRLMIDVESQNDFRPGYPLLRRAVYYCGRMLSRQGAGEVAHSHYERVRKVVSIWICLDPPASHRGTLNRLAIADTSVAGSVRYDPADYDLMEVVMVCVGPSQSPSSNLLDFLATLFDVDTSPDERLAVLHDEFGVSITKTLEDGVSEMGDLGWGVWRRGFEEGRAEGKAEGKAEVMLQTVANVMRNLSLDAEQAMDAVGVPESERAACAKRLTA